MRLVTYRNGVEAGARLGVMSGDLVVDVAWLGEAFGVDQQGWRVYVGDDGEYMADGIRVTGVTQTGTDGASADSLCDVLQDL